MTERIDSFYMNLAKWLIIIPGFFGINRRLVMNIFLTLSCCGYIFHCCISETNIFWRLIITPILLIMFSAEFVWANLKYREDDVLPDLGPRNANWMRVRIMMLWLTITAINALTDKDLSYLGLLICYEFDMYILLNQNTKSRHTLKTIVKSILRNLQSALQPAPEPVPVRIPA